jgi:hypothetical protein
MLTKDNSASFERDFSACLDTMVRALPPHTATLRTKPEIDAVSFAIAPASQESATIEGHASTQGGINFKIGRATTVELSRSNLIRFVQICKSVFSSHFTEFVIYGSTGRTLYSRIELEIEGHKVCLGGHQLFWWLFTNRRKERYCYRPYY